MLKLSLDKLSNSFNAPFIRFYTPYMLRWGRSPGGIEFLVVFSNLWNVVPLTPHQDGTKEGRNCNHTHTTCYLDDLWATLQWA